MRQSDAASAHGLTVLRLTGKGSAFKTCSGDHTIRKLRADVDGRFRTRGRYASATAHGTQWVMKDSCNGTLTVVARGDVGVDDFGTGKRTVVQPGERYLAKPARPRRRAPRSAA